MLRRLILLLVFSPFVLFAQTNGDTRVYIAPCTGDEEADSRFFDENFARELSAAGYMVVQNETAANYRINLQTEPNADYGEYEDAKLRILNIALTYTRTGREIIRFSWEYDSPREMAGWSLDILYRIMPNLASPEDGDVSPASPPEPGQWRNKRFYALAYGGADFTWFLSENINGAEYTYTGPLLSNGRRKYINTGNNQGGMIRPLAGAGAEFQFLDYLSAETGLKFRFNNVEDNKNVPVLSLPLYLKFVLKPGRLFMLEPYAGIEFNISTNPEAIRPAVVSAAGGFQFGIWGGRPGAAFIDANFSVDLGLSDVKGPYGAGKFQRIALGFAVGYKFGFYNRNRNTAGAAPPPANAEAPAGGYDEEVPPEEPQAGAPEGEQAGDPGGSVAPPDS
jgi:hypothetical protein